ncbi:hypothetical protein [Novosphingobium sp. B 225]|uniref:hypothetical protein n=1 Tax=Novosphingobium sp. B 225 TaxID=1961849 RepID=UPI000B4A81DE|nr:hypothetical protein [Novosphingobium sp. B 225]
MLIRPELAALRSDPAPQRQAQARLGETLERWRQTAAVATVDADLARYGEGAELEDLPALSALFDPRDGAARQLADGLVALLLGELEHNPFALVLLRHFTDELISSLMLLRRGTATIALQAIDGTALARRPEPVSVTFSPTQTVEHVLSGAGEAQCARLVRERPGGAELVRSVRVMQPGTVVHRDGASETQWLCRVEGSLVSLKLQRRPASGGVLREFMLADGALAHQAAASARDSKLELTASLLGRMGRSDAAPLLAAMAEEQGSAAMRWQVLRECLALDSAEGFRALGQIARNAQDPLSAPAGALRAQLLEQYPVLAGVEPCPA